MKTGGPRLVVTLPFKNATVPGRPAPIDFPVGEVKRLTGIDLTPELEVGELRADLPHDRTYLPAAAACVG